MKLVTYNVQSGRDAWGQLKLDGCCEMIKRLDPDILGLNELRKCCADSGNVDQPAYIAEKTGLEHRFAKAIPMASGEYGIGLFSRYPITEFGFNNGIALLTGVINRITRFHHHLCQIVAIGKR